MNKNNVTTSSSYVRKHVLRRKMATFRHMDNINLAKLIVDAHPSFFATNMNKNNVTTSSGYVRMHIFRRKNGDVSPYSRAEASLNSCYTYEQKQRDHI